MRASTGRQVLAIFTLHGVALANHSNLHHSVNSDLPISLLGSPIPPVVFENVTCLAPFTSEEADYHEEETLCLYTSPSFWHARGISIFTNEASYSQINTLEPIQLPHLQLPPAPPPEERLFSVVSMPGKGMAGVANTFIEPGTTILAQHPSLITHSPDDGRDGSAVRSQYHEMMVDALPSAHANDFLALSSHFDENTPLVDGIINTNAFAIQIGSEPHRAIFPEISRFNHDCRPNAEYTWSEKTFSMDVRATRLIEPGEEVTVSYIHRDLPAQERKDTLHNMWGFHCSCKFCSLSPEHTEASDHRVSAMSSILDQIDSIPDGASFKASEAQSMMDEYLRLALMERLHIKIPEVYTAGAKLFASFLHQGTSHNHTHSNYSSHLHLALNFTGLAIKTGMQMKGSEWAELQEMTDLRSSLLGELR